MTKLLEHAIELARGLPEGAQDEIARLILRAARKEADAIALTPDEEASFDESIAQEEAGQFVSDDEVRAFWRNVRA